MRGEPMTRENKTRGPKESLLSEKKPERMNEEKKADEHSRRGSTEERPLSGSRVCRPITRGEKPTPSEEERKTAFPIG